MTWRSLDLGQDLPECLDSMDSLREIPILHGRPEVSKQAPSALRGIPLRILQHVASFHSLLCFLRRLAASIEVRVCWRNPLSSLKLARSLGQRVSKVI